MRRPQVVPEWRYCRVCDLIEAAEAAGPPGGKDSRGYHLTLVRAHYDDDPKEATDG